jgi:hypothetical protein
MRVRRRGRDHHVFSPAKPQNERGDKHECARNAEGNTRAQMAKEQRHERRGKERAEVDDPIKSVEHHFGAMFVGLIELVADKCGHARLDAARAERDETEAGVKPNAVRLEGRKAGVPCAINQAQPEDGVVFAEKTVGQPAAEQRKKINADNERVKNILRAALALGFGQIKQQRRNEENGQDVPHPVKTEPFASLVADDVTDLFRNRRVGIGNARRF